MTTTPTRRERLRTATVAEIKNHGRRLLTSGGPGAVSLRAIARDMGMTAPAIYRYFPSLDALVREITEDLYDELREHIEAARDTVSADEPAIRLAEMARAFRRWCVAHPPEFGLMYGEPVPGVKEFEDGCVTPDHAGARFGAPFLDGLAQIWYRCPFPAPPKAVIEATIGPHLAPYLALHRDTGLPIEVIYAYLASWARLYGLVALEVFGHLQWALTTVESLFEIELAAFVAELTAEPS